MRTTLTLDDALSVRLRQLAHSRHSSFKDIVNQALERGIDELTSTAPPKPYRTRPRHLGALKGVDPSKLGQIADTTDDLHRMGADT